MNFTDFKDKFLNLPVLQGRDIVKSGKLCQSVYNQLERWKKRGLLIQLRRGLYVLRKTDRKIEPSRLFLAGQLYVPSYVSLEYVLSYYSIIPERVPVVTSVTTKKTAQFENEFGAFTYQTVKPAAFRGFISQKDEAGLACFMAEPEKAVVDFLYLNLGGFNSRNAGIFTDSYRFQNLGILNKQKLLQYAALFGVKKLAAVVKNLCGVISGLEAKHSRHIVRRP